MFWGPGFFIFGAGGRCGGWKAGHINLPVIESVF